jgi:hypothetical protein
MKDMSHLTKDKGAAAPSASTERRFVRYNVRIPCDLYTNDHTKMGTVVDISAGGCKVECECRFEAGTYLPMTLNVYTSDRSIDIDLAVVRWCGDTTFGMEFIRMDPLHQQRLRLLVRYIESDLSLGSKARDTGADP